MRSFLELFNRMETDYAERTAIRWLEDDSDIIQARSYAELCADIRRSLHALRGEAPLQSGTHVAILARSGYDYVVAALALLLQGCVLVPMNYEKSSAEIADELSRADVSVVIHDGCYAEREGSLSGIFDGRLMELADYHKHIPLSGPIEATDCHAPAMILYTSGSTGVSKGVVHSQSSILCAVEQDIPDNQTLQAFYGKKPGEHVSELVVAPLYHVCSYDRICCRFLVGDTVELCTGAMLFSRCLRELDGEVMLAFPVIYETLYKYVRSGKLEKLGKLRLLCSCGAPINGDVMRVLAAHGFAFSNGLGLTETFGSATRNMSCRIELLESIGPAQGNVEYRLAPNGELIFRGESLMLGYYNDPAATAEVIDEEGWFHTGDLAREDENGYLYIIGRSKNLIILSSGENINPEELEALLLHCEEIEECYVKEKDKKLCAVIYCPAEQQQTVRDYIAEMNRSLPRYKQINLLEFTAEPLPRTATGKILRG